MLQMPPHRNLVLEFLLRFLVLAKIFVGNSLPDDLDSAHGPVTAVGDAMYLLDDAKPALVDCASDDVFIV